VVYYRRNRLDRDTKSLESVEIFKVESRVTALVWGQFIEGLWQIK
jgi:hypothetical protein